MLDEELCKLYEQAMKANPGNEELGTQLFFSLVRLKDYKRQQHTAFKLYKSFGNTRYMFWGIMSVLLQGNCVEGDPKMFYLLAKKMIEKCKEDDLIKSVEELHLYLAVLLELELFQEALDIMNGELGNLFTNQIEKASMKFELLKKIEGGWDEIARMSSDLILSENVDDWAIVVGYFESLKNCGKVPSLEILTKLREKKERNSLLALLECSFIFPELNFSRMDQLIDYIVAFGSKDVCFYDIKNYLPLLSQDEVESLFSKIRIEWTVESCSSSITWLKISRFIRGYCLHEDKQLDAETLFRAYNDSNDFIEKINGKRAHEDLIILAVYSLLDLFGSKPSISCIIQSLAMLKRGIQENAFNFELKLLAIRLYEKIGALKPALSLFKSLDIKNIQLDTLSFVVSDLASTLGSFDESIILAVENLVIYQSNKRETPEMVIQAYRYGTFSKITEFIIFWEHLEYSIQRLLSSREIVRIEMMRNIKSISELANYLGNLNSENIPFFDKTPEIIHDNRDKDIMNFDTLSLQRGKFEIFECFKQASSIFYQIHSLIPLFSKNLMSNDSSDHILKQLRDLKAASDIEDKEMKMIDYLEVLFNAAINLKASNIDGLSALLKEITSIFQLTLDFSASFGTLDLGEGLYYETFQEIMSYIERLCLCVNIIGLALYLIPNKIRKTTLKTEIICELSSLLSMKFHDLKAFLTTLESRLCQDNSILFTSASDNLTEVLTLVSSSWKSAIHNYAELIDMKTNLMKEIFQA